MSNNSKRPEAKTRDDASRADAAAPQHRGVAGDARSSEQARKQGTQQKKAGTTARKRRPPFVL